MLKTSTLVNLIFQTIPAHELNWAYRMFSKLYDRKSSATFMESLIPRILPTQKEIEAKAAKKLAQVLTIIKLDFFKQSGHHQPLQTPPERHQYRQRLTTQILEMLSHGQLERNGSSIFLQEQDIAVLAQLIEVDATFFRNKAGCLKILRSIIDDPTKLSYLRNEVVEMDGEEYTLQHYRVITKDGMVNNLTMLVDDLQVTAGDKRPSIILVPGIACSSYAFHVNSRYSLAKDLARRGYWVYLFEPRGMGRNRVAFDVDCTLDTLIDDDLPSVIEFVYKRSKGKPVILLGHSMGGIVVEFMVQLLSKQENQDTLSKIKGVITLGSPKLFDKNSHLIYPFILWLNYALPLLKVDRVPMREILSPLTKTPLLKQAFRMLLDMDWVNMNFLIHPDNFDEPSFMFDFIRRATDTFPLGIGFQFQKAIYTGRGLSRMDNKFTIGTEKYNYTKNAALFSPNIPLVHFLAEDDPLALPGLNNFAQAYLHASKRTLQVEQAEDVFTAEPSQLVYLNVPKTKHIDLLYGKTASRWVYPLLYQAIEAIW